MVPGQAIAAHGRPRRFRATAAPPPLVHPPLTGGSTATSSPSASAVARPSAGSSPFTHTRELPRTARERGPYADVAASRSEPTVGAPTVVLVVTATGRLARRGEQPQRDGHDATGRHRCSCARRDTRRAAPARSARPSPRRRRTCPRRAAATRPRSRRGRARAVRGSPCPSRVRRSPNAWSAGSVTCARSPT